MNTVFIPQSTTSVLLQQQLLRDPGSLNVVSLREGLSTGDGPTLSFTNSLQRLIYLYQLQDDK